MKRLTIIAAMLLTAACCSAKTVRRDTIVCPYRVESIAGTEDRILLVIDSNTTRKVRIDKDSYEVLKQDCEKMIYLVLSSNEWGECRITKAIIRKKY